MTKTVLLLGSGGKEHAWAIALQRSGTKIISWAPEINPGVELIASDCIAHPYEKNGELLADYIGEIDLAIIGQTSPMVEGIGDWLETLGITTFNPSAKNAKLEASKSYMREFLTRNHIAGNIEFAICQTIEEAGDFIAAHPKFVVKPDGLTGGEGVKVHGDHFQSIEEGKSICEALLESDQKVLLEEKVEGIEFTLQGLVYDQKIVYLPLVRDYKRAYDNDIGPNTGSMGACSFPDHNLPYLSEVDLKTAKLIIQDVLKALKIENGPYKGAIYGQFTLTDTGPKIIEFNTRLGDPEAINTLPLLDTDLLEVIEILFDEKRSVDEVKFKKIATCVLYLVPEGFPENTKIGKSIQLPSGFEDKIILAYLKRKDDQYLTTKKRSLMVLGTGINLIEAQKEAYSIVSGKFEGLRYRSDIANDYVN